MRILVTGGTGFLGQKLAFRLANMGYEVTATGRNKTTGKLLEENGIKFVHCPLEDRHRVLQVCKDKDYIFHSGALSSLWGKYKDFYNANVLGTKHIIEGSQKSGIQRLIHVSTPSIYFYYDERQDVVENEKIPDTFVNHYAKTKYMAEQAMDQAFNHGLPVITIRPRALFGPGDNSILPRLIKVCEKGALPIIGTKDVLVDITYIDNVVDALLLCMHSPKHTLGQKYNITNGEQVSLYEVIENVMKRLGKEVKYKKISYHAAFTIAALLEGISKTILFGKEPILTKYTVSVLSKSQTLNIDKAQKELGYIPNISIEEGITKFVNWWETQ